MTEWISVKTALPKNNQRVLVFYKFDPSDGSWDHSRGMKITSFSFGKRVYETYNEKPGYQLTHWKRDEPNWGMEFDDRYEITHWSEVTEP